MTMLRLAVLVLVVVFAAAQSDPTDSEVLDASFYGLDEPEPTELPVPAEPTGAPGVDGGRRHGGGHHRGRHHHRGHHGMRGGNWTDEQKLTHLCSKIQSDSSSTDSRRGGRHSSRIHYKLRSLNETTRQTFINLWNQRKQEMVSCCNQATMPAKMQCVNDAKTARYDRICSGQEPLCHWSALRASSSRPSSGSNTTPANYESSTEITTRCCALSGTARSTCFFEAKNFHRQRYQGHHSRSHGSRGGRSE